MAGTALPYAAANSGLRDRHRQINASVLTARPITQPRGFRNKSTVKTQPNRYAQTEDNSTQVK
jgi:hypothetical protein